MTNTEALAAFMRGETLDDPTSRRLAALGWVTTIDVSEHNPEGRREVMAVELTDQGRKVWKAMLLRAEMTEAAKRPRAENQNRQTGYDIYID